MSKDKYIDTDEKLKFKEIKIRITEEMYDEWSNWAKQHDKSLDQYIKSSVESQALREMVIDYLDARAKNRPWWEKRFKNF
jgi:predicted HicB family RNase H-like nuclease